MSTFKGIIEGDFDNNAELLGYNVNAVQELLGEIGRMPREQQGAVMRKLFGKNQNSGNPENSRVEFQSKFSQLPTEIQKGLMSKRLQMVDTRFYIVKDINGKTIIDIFQGTDNKNIGLANVANQKLEKDNWFIVSAIMVRFAQYIENKDGATEEYSHIPDFICNGEFEFEAGNKKLIGLCDNSVFNTRERHNSPIGLYKLENTKLIEPQVEIKMPIKFTRAGTVGNRLRVTLIGTSVIPY